jgi:ABC-2 type transport system ATP-binding protein
MADIEQVCERVIIINMGRIVYDGRLRDLSGFNGSKKQIRAVFDGPWEIEQIEKLGKIVEKNGQEVLIEVEPTEAASVASHLFSNFSVRDISISNPPLEKVVESIYLKGRE